jgi:hypothetical protein
MAAEDWWLRSPDIGTILSGMDFNVNHNMIDYHPGDTAAYVYNENGVRPAFNIGLNPIISTSLIPGTQENPGAEYKLTILDNDLSVSVNEFSKSSDNEITLSYTIADSSTTAEPTQLSALVTDGNTTWTDNHWYDKRGRDYISYLQYTKLDVENFGLSGSGTFILDPLISGTWGEDYHVYILAEDVNGEKETDYASVPVELRRVNDAFNAVKPTSPPAPMTAPETAGVPKTGDTANFPLWISLILLGLIGIGSLGWTQRKHRG